MHVARLHRAPATSIGEHPPVEEEDLPTGSNPRPAVKDRP
jgi:hypothetical protein